MDSALRHIGNFISKEEDGTAAVYLNALEDHINSNTSQRDIIHTLDIVNFLLSKAKTRMLGLRLLGKILPSVTQDMVEQKFQLWTTFILKACNQDELQKYGGLIYEILANLATVLRQYAELSKSFASNHLTKIYEVITLSPTGYYISALKCAETYLSIYPKPNGQSREAMVRFLKIFPDKFDDGINFCAGKCLHFLQQTAVPGSKDMKTKEQWKTYQLQLIESLSAMLNEAYAESNGNDGNNEKNDFCIPPLELSSEPDVRAAQLFVRFHNLSNYLRIALSEPYLTSKPIMPKRLLNLITRGLVVTCSALNQDTTYSKIAFGVFLPKIQLDLLELCKVLISTLHTHLRIYYKSLLGCLIHVLKSTSSTNKALRAEVYNVITLWCQTLGEGSCCEVYADELVPEILKDVSPVKNELISQAKPKNKHKKAYQPINTKECLSNTLEKTNRTFYQAPIKCLQTIIASCSCFLKPTTVTSIQSSVLRICVSFFVTNKNDAFKDWKNRLEMYRLLHTLLMTPNQHSPPPSQIIFYILHTAQVTESNAEIRLTCTKMLADREKIVHPQKESLVIPIEARTIRNAFIKLGQESILEQSHAEISNLRYGYAEKENTEEAEEPYTNGENCNGTDRSLVEENIEEMIENLATQPIEEQISHVISNANAKKNSLKNIEDDFVSAPKAKKQKVEEVLKESLQQNLDTIDFSDDSNSEIENLGPINTLQQSFNNVSKNNAAESNKDTFRAENKSKQPNSGKLELPKNEDNEIAEMEAFFVDELKGN